MGTSGFRSLPRTLAKDNERGRVSVFPCHNPLRANAIQRSIAIRSPRNVRCNLDHIGSTSNRTFLEPGRRMIISCPPWSEANGCVTLVPVLGTFGACGAWWEVSKTGRNLEQMKSGQGCGVWKWQPLKIVRDFNEAHKSIDASVELMKALKKQDNYWTWLYGFGRSARRFSQLIGSASSRFPSHRSPSIALVFANCKLPLNWHYIGDFCVVPPVH